MIIDTHCHLYSEEYENLDEVIKEVKDSNTIAIINGIDPESNKEAIELANKYDFLYVMIGFHPEKIDEIKEEDYNKLELQLSNKKVLGIGEIGLDYYWNKNNKEQQIVMFKKLLDIAKKYNKPINVHSREATNDVYNILRKYNLKGIIHAFSGSKEIANMFIKLGYYIGIGGVLTFKNSNLKDVIKDISMEYIVLETDSPYLTPEPYRGKQNRPNYVSFVAKKLAEIKSKPYNEICEATTENVAQIFDFRP
jgi:TatD DNase family protein